ncbi:hypothetical protein WJX73_007254 [Symbiochloris irregularis]|uniref:SRPBCC family protein n=1 Tax=Symbiochloris irregularis TaxID=706552 RepID=A0AAW1NZV7_9CHLO
MELSQSQIASNGLVHLKVRVSGVIEHPLAVVWNLVRNFANVQAWLLPVNGSAVRSELLKGHNNNQMECVRVITIDGHQFLEQLEGLDDVEHVQRYKLISHPGASNPFPYAYLNFRSFLQCRSITVGDHTFMEWEGDLDTEPAGVEFMYSVVDQRLTAGFAGLRSRLSTMYKPAGPAIGARIGTTVPTYASAQPHAQYSAHQPPPTAPAANPGPYYDPYRAGPAPGGPVDMFTASIDPMLPARMNPAHPGHLSMVQQSMRNSAGSDISHNSGGPDYHADLDHDAQQRLQDAKHRST